MCLSHSMCYPWVFFGFWSMCCAGVRSGSRFRCSWSAPWMFGWILFPVGPAVESVTQLPLSLDSPHFHQAVPAPKDVSTSSNGLYVALLRRPICRSPPTLGNIQFPLSSSSPSIKSQPVVEGWTTRHPAFASLSPSRSPIPNIEHSRRRISFSIDY